MRTLTLFAITGMLLGSLPLTPSARAESYAVGFVNSDGYSWDGSYWAWGGYQYTRTWVNGSTYYYNGCWYQRPGYYSYTKYVAPTPAVSYSDPDWRGKLLDIAAAQKKTEARIVEKAVDQAQYMEAIDALGLKGALVPRIRGTYGIPPGYAGYGAYGATVAGLSGNTVYGYGVSNVLEIYGDTNLAALYQQSYRLADQALKGGDAARAGHQTLVDNQSDRVQRVAAILARGQAGSQVLKAADGQGSIKSTTTITGSGTIPTVQPQSPAMPRLDDPKQPDNLSALENLLATNCAACHGATKQAGGLDLRLYPQLGDDIKDKILERVSLPSNDPKFMPRAEGGGPGVPLTRAQKRLLLGN